MWRTAACYVGPLIRGANHTSSRDLLLLSSIISMTMRLLLDVSICFCPTPCCLHGQAPRYLADHVIPAIEVASRHRLRSANRHRLIVPRCRLNTYGRPRTFPVAGPTVWNSLPDELRDPACDVDSFKQFFKTILFSSY